MPRNTRTATAKARTVPEETVPQASSSSSSSTSGSRSTAKVPGGEGDDGSESGTKAERTVTGGDDSSDVDVEEKQSGDGSGGESGGESTGKNFGVRIVPKWRVIRTLERPYPYGTAVPLWYGRTVVVRPYPLGTVRTIRVRTYHNGTFVSYSRGTFVPLRYDRTRMVRSTPLVRSVPKIFTPAVRTVPHISPYCGTVRTPSGVRIVPTVRYGLYPPPVVRTGVRRTIMVRRTQR